MKLKSSLNGIKKNRMNKTGVKERVAVYDGDFIPFYVCHNKKDEPIKTLEDCKQLCDEFIRSINTLVQADSYLGYLTIGKCFRYTVNPNYKANRKYTDLPEFLYDIKQYLQDNHGFTFNSDYEADDLVVSFKAKNSQYESIIISPDKDILTSVDIAYNPRKNEFVENTADEINAYFLKSMITGDSVDGIKGIPGKGKAFADKLLLNIDDQESLRGLVFDEYILHFGEYEGIKEFYRNYLSLKMIDDLDTGELKLNKIEKIDFCE